MGILNLTVSGLQQEGTVADAMPGVPLSGWRRGACQAFTGGFKPTIATLFIIQRTEWKTGPRRVEPPTDRRLPTCRAGALTLDNLARGFSSPIIRLGNHAP